MKRESRTGNVAKNAAISVACQIFSMIVQIIARRIFVIVLTEEYLGVSGLFSNILTILSFAELGIGNAMVFSMYKPLAENDTEKLKSLMLLYKKAYRIIGAVILGAGLCVIPALGAIIKEKPDISENLTVIYIFYLLNTSMSYLLWAYKKSIISADQKLYVVNIVQQVSLFVQAAVQSVILLATKNFYLYLAVQLAATLLDGFIVSRIADRQYPFLKEKAKPLSAKESRSIFDNVRSLVVYKFGGTILNGTDNIIVSAMFSLSAVGIVSNFNFVISFLTTFLGRITSSFTASVGNLNTENDPEKQYSVFMKLFFLCSWMFGFAAFGITLFSNDIVTLLFGKKYAADMTVVIALALSFYVSSVQFPAFTYRTTFGLFREGKIAPAVAAAVNIASSVLLGKLIGLSGVFFATAISRFGAVSTTDVFLIYRRKFKKNPFAFFAVYFVMLLLIAAITAFTYFVLSFIKIEGIAGLCIRIAAASVIFNGMFFIIFRKSAVYRELKQSFSGIIRKVFHSRKSETNI